MGYQHIYRYILDAHQPKGFDFACLIGSPLIYALEEIKLVVRRWPDLPSDTDMFLKKFSRVLFKSIHL